VRDLAGPWRRTAIASLVICAAGGALLARGTDGFRALTSEQARRNAIARAPRSLPNVALEDQDGRPFALGAYLGRPIAVDFVYTQCRSVCTLSSAGFQRLDRAERSRNGTGDDRLQLVSISFDPRDTPARLREYASRYRADGRAWRFARVRDARDLGPLVRTFGIVVIPTGGGDFQHNAALHLVDAEGRLARVLDAGAQPDEVAQALASMGSPRTLAATRLRR
jgi:protein SCO1/2